jgi:hypothetical protein
MTAGSPGTDWTGPPGPLIRPFLGGPSTDPGPPPRNSQPEPVGLRPYILTAGRVYDAESGIGPETQVVTRADRPATRLSPEQAAIIALCTQPVSVAEMSARLRLHLGVARVLVGDLRAAGVVRVHTRNVTGPHSPETILRVIRGLRAIS